MKKIYFELFLDVIGVVKSASDVQTIVSKASQKEFTKRDILLVDEKASISVTLWAQQVEINLRKNCFLKNSYFRLKNLMDHQIQLLLLKELKLEILVVYLKEILINETKK
jgi:hypothetical protein